MTNNVRASGDGTASGTGRLNGDSDTTCDVSGRDRELSERLHPMVADSGNVVEYLDLLVRSAVEVLGSPGEDVFCGATLLRPRRAATVASSNELAQEVAEVQYGFDDGPCLTAAQEEGDVYLEDAHHLPVSSPYRQAMESFRVRSVLAVPISLSGNSFSALNLYSTKPDAFTSLPRSLARRFAEKASHSLQIAMRLAELADTGAGLRAAMEGRHIIDTAVGVIVPEPLQPGGSIHDPPSSLQLPQHQAAGPRPNHPRQHQRRPSPQRTTNPQLTTDRRPRLGAAPDNRRQSHSSSVTGATRAG